MGYAGVYFARAVRACSDEYAIKRSNSKQPRSTGKQPSVQSPKLSHVKYNHLPYVLTLKLVIYTAVCLISTLLEMSFNVPISIDPLLPFYHDSLAQRVYRDLHYYFPSVPAAAVVRTASMYSVFLSSGIR